MAELLRERYEPIEVVGQGGEGRVLKAIDRQHDRLVALKIRSVSEAADREAVLSEARVLLAVPPHAHLSLVREDFFEGDQYVIAMDWIEGTDLQRTLHARGRPGLAVSSVLRWLADAASALTHLHTLDPPVVHGDVKPANLVLTSGGRIVLVDFGLSSSPGSHRRRHGTPGFAAPELAAGDGPTRASDVYSLAATAFALLSGDAPRGIRPTWEGIDPRQAERLEEAIRSGLATDPARRPATVGELVERLRAGWDSTLPTGVLTFCLTDIEGSTGLWESNPADMARALVRHDELMADVVERHDGRFLKSMGEGDSTVSVFLTPQSALDAMAEFQRCLADLPDAGPVLRVRASVHTGEAEQRGGDYFGPTLNVAGRLRAQADGGQIFVSGDTAALVRDTLPDDMTLVELGLHRLRGVGRPVPVFALAAAGVAAPMPATKCPYPGLPAYQADDADRFFGREAVVDELRARLGHEGFVAVVGASGSGKSSVLRAGLAAQTRAVVLTPGSSPEPLVDGDVLVIVDQLEEAFTLCDDMTRRSAFLDSIVDRRGPVAVGIRADFYGRCAEHQRLATAMAGHHVLLGPLGTDELRRAIVGPAEAFGLRVDPTLVEALVADVAGEPGALPLLSHALRTTWERRDGRTLTLDAYRATGGLRAAIATTAEDVYGRLDDGARGLARRTFLALTEPGQGTEDSRRWATLAELTPPDGEERVRSLLEAMTAARLVSRAADTVAVAHEALIREWPRLRAWLDEDRDGLRLHRHLTAAASAWDAAGREPSELYRGTRLAAAIEWSDRTDDVSNLEIEFLAASRADQDRAELLRTRAARRLRGFLVGVGVALVVAVVAAVIAFAQRRVASDASDRAEVARVAAVSRSVVDEQPDLGLLLAAAAYRLDDTANTRSTLLSAIEAHPLLSGLIYGVDSALEAAAFTPDGRLLATPTTDGTGTILWDTVTHDRVDTLKHDDDNALDLAISPDGRTLAVPGGHTTPDGRAAGQLEIWDLTSRTLTTVVPSPAGLLSTADFSSDGTRLFTQGGLVTDTEPPDVVVEWDTSTWEPVGQPWVLDPSYSGDEALVVSADGGRIALALADRTTIGVWQVDGRAALRAPIALRAIASGAEGPITRLAFAPDGTLAVATDMGGVFFVDPETGEETRDALRLPDSVATALTFDADGSMLAVGRADGRTQLYDVASGAPLGPALAASASEIVAVAFSRDGSSLATTSADRIGAIWRLDGGRAIGTALHGQDGPITEAVFSADGRDLLTSAFDGTVAVRDGATGAVRRTIDVGDRVLSVDASPVGSRAAAGGTAGTVVLFDLDGGRRVDVDLGGVWAHQVAFSPDGGVVAVAIDAAVADSDDFGAAGELRFLDAITGDDVGQAIDIGQSMIGVGWSPDGQTVLGLASNNVAHLFAADSRREIAPAIENVDAPFLSFAFSPDGEQLALGTSTGTVRRYALSNHQPIGEPLAGEDGGTWGLAYSPDGTLLAGSTAGFSTTRLWDADSGVPIGDRLTGGRVPFTYRTFQIDHILGARPAFAPDGLHLVTPGFDGATMLWDLDPDRWLDAACDVVGRDLTADEWDRHIPDRNPTPICPR